MVTCTEADGDNSASSPLCLFADLFTSPQTDLFRNGTTCPLRDAEPDNLH